MRTLLVLALLVGTENKGDKAELKKFQGTWQLVSEFMDGKERALTELFGRVCSRSTGGS